MPEVPSLLGAAGPVAGVAGVAVGRDMVISRGLFLDCTDRECLWSDRWYMLYPEQRRIRVKTRSSEYAAVDVTDVLGCKDLLELNLIVNGIKSVE